MAGILIIEDEGIIAINIKQKLLKRGFEVAGIASNGVEAKELLDNEDPDLILIDIMLEGNSEGIEIAHSIKQNYLI